MLSMVVLSEVDATDLILSGYLRMDGCRFVAVLCYEKMEVFCIFHCMYVRVLLRIWSF